MSLAVARLITPMLAAYFLAAQGPQKHGEGPLIDPYMRVLRWRLDTRAADAARARGGRWKWLDFLNDHRLWVVGIARKRVVQGQSVFVRFTVGGRRTFITT